jgi:hypothetical protein
MLRNFVLLIFVAGVACEIAFSQVKPIDDLRRMFDYQRRASLDVKENGVEVKAGVSIHDISYASPKGGRVTAYLVVPSRKGKFAGLIFMHVMPSALFLQFGKKDNYPNEAMQTGYAKAASDPKLVKTYDAGHELNHEALRDRAEWLRRQLKLDKLN